MATISVATASHRGGRARNADAVAAYRDSDTGLTAAVVVDGIGTEPAVVELAELAAKVAVRVGAKHGALAGLLSTSDLATYPMPDAVACLAVHYPDDDAILIAQVGDCRAYSWDGDTLTQHTEDHTTGQQMRRHGALEAEALEHDDAVLTTIGRAVVATVTRVQVTAPLVILTSDGVHKPLSNDRIAELVRAHAADPQVLADQLVVVAIAADGGPHAEHVDNASAVVLRLDTPVAS